MVSKLRTLPTLLLLLATSLTRGAGIDVQAPATAELGKAFSVELDYLGEADLQSIPLSGWRADFVVDRGYVRRDGNRQQLRLRLTARRSGDLTLPPLQLGPADSVLLSVQVSPAIENGEPLEPNWQLDTTSAWQGQELVASLTLDSRHADRRLDTAEPRWPGYRAQALPLKKQPLADGRTRYRLGWLLRALDSGERSLAAPELRLLRDGVPVRRFHFPEAVVAIRPAPVYLPPTVPVGRLVAKTDSDGRTWLVGQGVPAALLQATLDRAGLKPSGMDEQHTPDGTRSRARLDWAASGLDRARLVYFEPLTGRLQQLDLAAPSPPAALWLLPPGLLLAVGLIWQRRRISAWLQRHTARQRLLSDLHGANTATACRDVLLGRARTLNAWLVGWQREFHAPAALAEQLRRIEATCYGTLPADAATADLLRRAIRHSRPRW